jgi:hypothetical protein
MARARRKSTLAKRAQGVPTLAWVAIGAAVTAGGIYLVLRSKAQTFEEAILNGPEGTLFLMWLALYRARLVEAPLEVGEPEKNAALLMRGFDSAGLMPSSTNDANALKRAICTKYKERQADGTLRPIPSGYSDTLRQRARTLVAAWEQECARVGVQIDPETP